MNARDIFMRYTDANGGTSVQRHRVWDADRFVAARQAEATKERNKEGGRNAAEQITEAQFLKERTK